MKLRLTTLKSNLKLRTPYKHKTEVIPYILHLAPGGLITFRSSCFGGGRVLLEELEEIQQGVNVK